VGGRKDGAHFLIDGIGYSTTVASGATTTISARTDVLGSYSYMETPREKEEKRKALVAEALKLEVAQHSKNLRRVFWSHAAHSKKMALVDSILAGPLVRSRKIN